MTRPVTVLTGFLGSGKTSLLNALIRANPQTRFAVVVNEFGALGIDGALIETSDDRVVELSNGCLCCTVRGDLLETFAMLADRIDSFDHVVIETSGLADPAPIAQTFLLEDGPADHFHLDGIVALADSPHLEARLSRSDIAARQIALADRMILSKTDLTAPALALRAETLIRRINPAAPILQSSDRNPATQALTGIGAYTLGNIPGALRFAPPAQHDGAIRSESFRFDRAFDLTAFSRFIRRLLAVRGDDILRIKGIIDLYGEDRRFVFHGVQAMVDGDVVGPWPDGPRESVLVVIGSNLDRDWIATGLTEAMARTDDCAGTPRHLVAV